MNPGQPRAHEHGCKCPKEFNRDGQGMAAHEHADPSEIYFMVAKSCPLHGEPTWKTSSTS